MLMMLACGRLLAPMGRDLPADAHDAHDAVDFGSLLPPMGRNPPADAHDAHDAVDFCSLLASIGRDPLADAHDAHGPGGCSWMLMIFVDFGRLLPSTGLGPSPSG